MHRTVTAAIGFLLICGCSKEPAPKWEYLTPAQLQVRLETASAETPGIVFGYIEKSGRAVVRSAGLADIANRRRAQPQTPFAWFSLTKLFTATAILQLADAQRLDLDAPVNTYVPELHLSRENREATVRQLLSHSAGLPNPVPVSWIHAAGESGPSLDTVLRQRLGTAPKLDHLPGAKAAYSNLGYVVLGIVIERVSGKPYKAYVEEHVLAPLGCQASGFALQSAQATGYQKKWSLTGLTARVMVDGRFFGETENGYWAIKPFAVDGASYGGLNGPVDCLLRFARMTMDEGRGAEGQVLSRNSVAAMLKSSVLSDGTRSPFGLAWRLGATNGEPYAEHEGGGGGYHAVLRLYPRMGIAVAVLANETSYPVVKLTHVIVKMPPEPAG